MLRTKLMRITVAITSDRGLYLSQRQVTVAIFQRPHLMHGLYALKRPSGLWQDPPFAWDATVTNQTRPLTIIQRTWLSLGHAYGSEPLPIILLFLLAKYYLVYPALFFTQAKNSVPLRYTVPAMYYSYIYKGGIQCTHYFLLRFYLFRWDLAYPYFISHL